MKMAFIYRVVLPDGSSVYRVQICSSFSYRAGDVEWQDNIKLPQYDHDSETGTLIPSPDLEESLTDFTSESEALTFMVKFYVDQMNIVNKSATKSDWKPNHY